jgi:hypothetical protein
MTMNVGDTYLHMPKRWSRCHSIIVFWMLTHGALFPITGSWYTEAAISITSVGGAAPQFASAQAHAEGSAEKSEAATPAGVTRGMGKPEVRQAWGAPEEVRKLRTCFGWQEEWVYRGNVERFGASERVLLFDEGEVLTEIK